MSYFNVISCGISA